MVYSSCHASQRWIWRVNWVTLLSLIRIRRLHCKSCQQTLYTQPCPLTRPATRSKTRNFSSSLARQAWNSSADTSCWSSAACKSNSLPSRGPHPRCSSLSCFCTSFCCWIFSCHCCCFFSPKECEDCFAAKNLGGVVLIVVVKVFVSSPDGNGTPLTPPQDTACPTRGLSLTPSPLVVVLVVAEVDVATRERSAYAVKK